MQRKTGKQDMRVTRTHKSLVSALLLLLESRSFQKITVNEICETAMVSRAAFYMHFEDKYHLLRFALEQTRFNVLGEAAAAGDREAVIRDVVEFTHDHAKLFRNLLLEDGNQELLQMFNTMFVEEFTAEFERMEQEGARFLMPVSVMAVFIAGGLSNLLVWWISGGFSQTKEEMVDQLTTFVRREKVTVKLGPKGILPPMGLK